MVVTLTSAGGASAVKEEKEGIRLSLTLTSLPMEHLAPAQMHFSVFLATALCMTAR